MITVASVFSGYLIPPPQGVSAFLNLPVLFVHVLIFVYIFVFAINNI